MDDKASPGELRAFGYGLMLVSVVCFALFAHRLGRTEGPDDGVGLFLGAGVVTIVLGATALLLAEIRSHAPEWRAREPGDRSDPPGQPGGS